MLNMQWQPILFYTVRIISKSSWIRILSAPPSYRWRWWCHGDVWSVTIARCDREKINPKLETGGCDIPPIFCGTCWFDMHRSIYCFLYTVSSRLSLSICLKFWYFTIGVAWDFHEILKWYKWKKAGTPSKINMNLKLMVWKTIFLFQGARILRFSSR